jgi:DNA-binding protein Fis
MSLDVLLARELKRHLPKIRSMANGGLHKMVIGLVEKSLVKIVLDETNGNQTDASRILGINRNTLRKKIKDYNIQN